MEYKTHYEWMNDQQVLCNQNGSPVRSLYDNGLCVNCEQPISGRSDKFCDTCKELGLDGGKDLTSL